MNDSSTPPPFRPVDFKPLSLDVKHEENGCIYLSSRYELEDIPPNMIQPIQKWAERAPDRTWLARRDRTVDGGGDWIKLNYGDGLAQVRAVGQALKDRGLGQNDCLMILSGNSIEHAIMTYGAIAAGVPAAPVSPSYSLMSSDFAKLNYVFELVTPKVLFVQDGVPFEKALTALNVHDLEIIYVDRPPAGFHNVTSFAELIATEVEDIDETIDALAFDMHTKYMFTSGSTGMPKACINNHRMTCTNAAMRDSMKNLDPESVPVILSWLPWNHTYGGNAVLNVTTYRGGSLYIDDGRPVSGQFSETVRNLRELKVADCSNVPAAYAMLVTEMERDEELAKDVFENLVSFSFGGAALPGDLNERLQRLAIKHTGYRIRFLSGYGSTETAPTIASVHWDTERMGLLGLPLPGVVFKLAPVGSKLELRVKGDCITPGYYRREDLTAKAFDEEGFYCMGDAVRFADPENVEEGILFDGRVAEDFKLDTGTWVSAGSLRVKAVGACDGLLQDALIAGQDKSFVGLLGFPNLGACQAFTGNSSLTLDEVATDDRIVAAVRDGLARHNKENPGSSTRIKRAILMAEPPNMDAGELTDKGYINQAIALGRRHDLVDKLYATELSNEVIHI